MRGLLSMKFKGSGFLDEVHRLIEENNYKIYSIRFQRQVKKGASNLLAGRAISQQMFPLFVHEVDTRDIEQV